MENRVDLQEIYDQAYSLMDDLSQLYTKHADWAQWKDDFKKYIDNMVGKNGKLEDWARDANKMLHGVGPDEKGPSPMTKEEKEMMKRSKAELHKLFAVAEKATMESIDRGELRAEDAVLFLTEFLQRILASMSDDNPLKEVLKHLKARVESGDEIATLLDRAVRTKQKREQTVNGGKVEVAQSNGSALQTLLTLAGGAAVAAMAPALGEKVANSGIIASFAEMLKNTLDSATTTNEEEVAVEEEEEVVETVKAPARVELSL